METVTVIRVDIPIVESHHKKNIELKECYLLLYDSHIEYKVVYSCLSDDNDEGIWKDAQTNYRWIRSKTNLSDIEMLFNNPEDKWQIIIDFVGVSDGVGWLYESPKEALKLYNQLKDYMVGIGRQF